MAAPTADEKIEPTLRNNKHLHTDKYETKLVGEAEKLEVKASKATGHDQDKSKAPAGGFDATPIPKAPPGYTIKITFHSARNLPFADLSLTSDPYIFAVIKTDLPKRHKQDPDLRIRTPTVHRDVNPVWNVTWTVAHIPASGFKMKCRLYDEDPRDHDDRLGNVHVDVDRIDDNWQGFKDRKFKVKKRMGSKRAYTLRGCAALLSRNVDMNGDVTISVENLGRSEGDNGGQPYTIGPLAWSQHNSPLIGMIAGVKEQSDDKSGRRKTEKYNFQAIQMQLEGPVPEPLYHRYVEFRSFIAGMFTSHTIMGRILNHAAHHQHVRIYNFDETTKYGSFDHPSQDMTTKFLEFVHHDQGGRIFTYVITLDGQFRFTETGAEFGINMLSKHTMHSNVSPYIAFSGEFFVRRLKHPYKAKNAAPDPVHELLPPSKEEDQEEDQHEKLRSGATTPGSAKSPSSRPVTTPKHTQNKFSESHLSIPSDQHASPPQTGKRRTFGLFRHHSHQSSLHSHASQTHEAEDPNTDPSHYELIIDNDSGTYRPNSKYLPELKKYLQRSFPGLKIAVLDCVGDEDKMKKLKGEQKDRKKNSGKQIMYMQNSSMSSFSSSDEEELERRAAGGIVKRPTGTIKRKYRQAKEKIAGGDDSTRERDKGEKPLPSQVGKDQEQITTGESSKAQREPDKSLVPGSESPTQKPDQKADVKPNIVLDDPPHKKTTKASTEQPTGVFEAQPEPQTQPQPQPQMQMQPQLPPQEKALSESQSQSQTSPPNKPRPQPQLQAQQQQEIVPKPTGLNPTSDASRPTTAILNKDNLEQHDQLNNLAFMQNQALHSYNGHFARKPSISTDADDRMSFNTAFTEAEQTDHFVTPKPSLGEGGLRQFGEDVNKESASNSQSGHATPKGKERADGDTTPKREANGILGLDNGLAHNMVTSNSFIGGGL